MLVAVVIRSLAGSSIIVLSALLSPLLKVGTSDPQPDDSLHAQLRLDP